MRDGGRERGDIYIYIYIYIYIEREREREREKERERDACAAVIRSHSVGGKIEWDLTLRPYVLEAPITPQGQRIAMGYTRSLKNHTIRNTPTL